MSQDEKAAEPEFWTKKRQSIKLKVGWHDTQKQELRENSNINKDCTEQNFLT